MRKSLKRINQGTFILFFGIVFISVLYKLIHVPITHDEYSTTSTILKSTYWELISYKDPIPNNHILNSILTKFVVSFTGVSQITIRLINLLSFLLFSWGVWRISSSIFSLSSLFFIPASLIFITNPYLLDFFSVCRGYGISIAFCTLSISFLLSGFMLKTNRHIWFALIFSGLASYANFTLLYFWMSTLIMAVFYFMYLRKTLIYGWIRNLSALFFYIAIYAILIALPISKMSNTNQFRFWNSNGFYSDTIYPLVKHSLYSSKALFFQLYEVMAILTIGILVFNLVYIIIQFRNNELRSKIINHPICITTSLFILTVLMNLIHTSLFNTPYLAGRTALFYYPLFVASFISTFYIFSKYKIPKTKFIWSVLCVALCIIQLTHTWNGKIIKEWSYDSSTLKVLSLLDQERSNNPISLDTDWLFNPSFSFYKEYENIEWLQLGPYSKEINPETKSKYYYVFAEKTKLLEGNFEVLEEFDTGGVLMVRRQ